MKMPIIIYLFLSIISTVAIAQNVHVFGAKISVQDNCTIYVSPKGKKIKAFKSPFPTAGKCQIHRHAETDIPRIEFIQGKYVLIIESIILKSENCRAKHAAMIVDKNGLARVSASTEQSSACDAVERKDYEILFHRSAN